MRYPPNDLSQLFTFRVPEANHHAFMELSMQIPLSDEVCSCGHPAALHKKGRCILKDTCACRNFAVALTTQDTRPFFQSTLGPFSVHALGRGMEVASRLDLQFEFEIHCMSKECDQIGVGAVRYSRDKRLRLSPVATLNEVHLINCYDCLDEAVYSGIRLKYFDLT